MTAYWPGISGVASTPRWDIAALLVIPLFVMPRLRMTGIHWIGLALLIWMGLTFIWNGGETDGRLDGAEAMFELLIAAVSFVVGAMLEDIRPLFVGAAIGIAVNSGICVAQAFGWDGSGIILAKAGGIPGLFYEKDRLAAAAAMVLIGLIAPASRRSWALVPLLLPALVLPHSRAAMLAIAAGIMTLFGRSLFFFLMVMTALLGGFVLFHIVDPAGLERLAIWRDTVANLNFFGHGLGSFREVFLRVAGTYDFNHWQSRPEAPHNEWLWLAFEGGIPAFGLGMVLALGIWWSAFDNEYRAVLAAFFVLSLFAMPFHDPATLALGALCAGFVVGVDRRICDGIVSRGVALRARVAADANRRKHEPARARESAVSVPAAVSRGDGATA